MRLTFKATNFSLTPALRAYAVEKFSNLARFFPEADPDAVTLNIELGRPSQHHRTGEVWRCEVNVSFGKKLLRAEDFGRTGKEAIDRVQDEIERQVLEHKDKRRSRFLRAARSLARRLKFLKTNF